MAARCTGQENSAYESRIRAAHLSKRLNRVLTSSAYCRAAQVSRSFSWLSLALLRYNDDFRRPHPRLCRAALRRVPSPMIRISMLAILLALSVSAVAAVDDPANDADNEPQNDSFSRVMSDAN